MAYESDLAGEHEPEGDLWCVAFVSVFSGYTCLQAIRGVDLGMLVSTRSGVEAAKWPTRRGAEEWLLSCGLAEGSPVPVGVGHMRALVWPFEHSWWRVCPPTMLGCLFEVPRGLMPAPAGDPEPPWRDPETGAEPPPRPTADSHARNGPKRSKRELAEAVAAGLPKPEPAEPKPTEWPALSKPPAPRPGGPAVQGSLF